MSRSSSIDWNASSIATGSVRDREEPRVQVLQQDDVDLAHELCRAVVALHQLLARDFRRRVGEPELVRERVLLVEDEPILAPTCEVVQPHAQASDEPLLAGNRARLLARDQARLRELAPGAAEPRRARDPQHRLQVAQARRGFP